jgi:radical SAM superfamily enzyme YgiQ (UPF0313 family)
MKIALINPTPPGISSFGIRSLSAILKREGHDVRSIFLPGSIGLFKEDGSYTYSYHRKVITDIVEICRDCDLIGVSFFTNYLDRAVQITAELKDQLKAPVIWGGIHASTKPEEALTYADMACIGEGENALLELLDKMANNHDITDVRGIWFRQGGQIVKNPLYPLISDLDTLPVYDFSNENHFLLDKATNRLEPLNDELFKENLPMMPGLDGTLKRIYRTMSDRGCPHHCTYCNVPTLKEIYKNDKSPFLRSRSVTHVIEELKDTLRRFPFIDAVQMFDDTFFARSTNYMAEFADLYKKNIGLPLYCQASPNTLSEKKLQFLLDAGLVYVEMGIQSGSAKIREMYQRSESNEKILSATRLLHKYRKQLITPDYHIIIDNPWETEEDTLETAKLLHQIPKPYGLAISSLVFYPKTGLYEKAVKEGIIQDEMKEIDLKPFYIPPKGKFVNFLIYLNTFQSIPKGVIGFLLRDETVKFMSKRNLTSLYALGYGIGEICRFFRKGLRTVLIGDWARIQLFFKKRLEGDPVVAGRKGD